MPITQADVEKFSHALEEAISKGDAHVLGAQFATDAKFLPNHHTILEGRSAIEEYFKSQPKNEKTKICLAGVTEGSDFAVAHGTYEAFQNGARVDVGKYLTVVRRHGDKLECVYDMFNTDTPMK